MSRILVSKPVSRFQPTIRKNLDYDQEQCADEFLAKLDGQGNDSEIEKALHEYLCKVFVSRRPTREAVRKYLVSRLQESAC